MNEIAVLSALLVVCVVIICFQIKEWQVLKDKAMNLQDYINTETFCTGNMFKEIQHIIADCKREYSDGTNLDKVIQDSCVRSINKYKECILACPYFE